MPTHIFPLTILTQKFEDETFLAEAFNFQEISRFHAKEDSAIFNVRLNAEDILKAAYASLLNNRIAPEDIEIREIFLEIAPPKKSALWRENITLKFHALQILREDGYAQAYVPALGIAVLSRKFSEFEQKVKDEILSALKREGYLKSLKYLRWLERIESVNLHNEEISLKLPTAKQRAIAEEKGETEEKSVLEETGENLNLLKLKKAYEVEKEVRILAELLRAETKTSILLVGASGVGKTAIFYELVRRRKEFNLDEKEFWATGGARLIAGQSGFGMWQERCAKLVNEAKKKNAVLHFGNLVELLEVGKSEYSTQGIASFLRPKMASGELVAIAECTPEQLPFLERRDPNLLSAFQQIRIEEPDRKTNLKILESVAKEFTDKSSAKIRKAESGAIKTIDAVHRRFSTYSALPSRPVRFLRNVFNELNEEETLTPQIIYRAFSNETGLPEMLLNDAIQLDLKATEKFFTDRIIGQPQACELIAKLIATVKTNLTRPRKPIASLLFIGPTGVGKTETVKALTEFFFSDKSRLIRFDMSEFSNPLSVQRLIGGTGEKEGLLTAKVREQPFSVVLLDEFEKAHHSFFDLLLQILGEGRLTDSVGRVADFTNSIIVMTSNLGASEFQRGKSGFINNSKDRQTAVKHFDSAVRNFLRPEIYNRLDRIVPFSPLDEKSVLKIADLEIKKLLQRDGLRFRPLKFDISKDVLNHFAHTGYEIRYGARPLRRTIERELLVPLASELNLREIEEKIQIPVSMENGKISFEFIGDKNPKKSFKTNRILTMQAERIAELRRKIQKFAASYRLTQLADELYQVARIESLQTRGRYISEEDKLRIERKPKVHSFIAKVRGFAEEINQYEDRILLKIYGKSIDDAETNSKEIEEKEQLFQQQIFELLSLQYVKPNEIKLSFFSENSPALLRLLNLYHAYLIGIKSEIKKVFIFTSQSIPDQKADEKILFNRSVWRKELLDKEKIFKSLPSETVGALIEIEGNLAFPKFNAETGVHRFAEGSKNSRVLINSFEGDFDKFKIPDELAKRDSIKFQFERRVYDLPQQYVRDFLLNKTFSLEHAQLQNVFQRAIEENLQKTAENLIE